MKLAISGKGGVGKTTLAALLARTFSRQGRSVLAIDADPDANLGVSLGMADADRMTPISEMKDLIYERTEARPGTIGSFFKLNPKVDDLPEKLTMRHENIRLMRLGGIKKGGGGCICPESTLLKALVTHIVLARDEVVIMDMEAGIEHLGRATAQAVDWLIIVLEPGRRSLETAGHIRRLADEIGLTRIAGVGNKLRGQGDRDFLETRIPDIRIIGHLPYDDAFIEADLNGRSPYDAATSATAQVEKIISHLKLER